MMEYSLRVGVRLFSIERFCHSKLEDDVLFYRVAFVVRYTGSVFVACHSRCGDLRSGDGNEEITICIVFRSFDRSGLW